MQDDDFHVMQNTHTYTHIHTQTRILKSLCGTPAEAQTTKHDVQILTTWQQKDRRDRERDRDREFWTHRIHRDPSQ